MTNVLLISVDSLRADHVGCYGYERNTTPVIDSLADDGVVFENAFAHACSTRPSFPTILTSTYPTMYGGFERLSEERTLVSEVFDAAGYRTGGFHSNAYLNPEFGYARGYDHFYDSMTDPGFLARARHAVKTRLDKDGVVYKSLAEGFGIAERQAGINVGSAYVDADEMTDRASRWLAEGSAGTPDFLWVHYMDVHHPYVPPAEHQRAFRSDPIAERDAIQLRRKFLQRPDEITDEEFEDIRDLYDAEIRFTDAEIGRLLEAAAENWDDYVVAVVADHGEEFRDHGEFGHSAKFYDEFLHVPFVYADGAHAGRFDDLVGLLDVSPTLLAASGLDSPDSYLGYDLHQLFDADWPRESLLGDWEDTSTGERRYAYRDEEWKYVRRDAGEELYHLPDDPGETRDVSDERPDVRADLAAAVDEHERHIAATDVDVGGVEMDEEVKSRLRDLGYKE